MKAIPLVILSLITGPLSGYDAQQDWLRDRRNYLETAKTSATSDLRIEIASPLVGTLGAQQRVKELPAETVELLEEARSLITDTPGFEEYFKRKIFEQYQADLDPSRGGIVRPRQFYFEVLQHLRHPASVRTLGELLSDERDPWNGKVDDGGMIRPNCDYALRALSGMGIRNTPGKDLYRDLKSWQLWYAQVRAGTRTFSFEDDARIYSLNGQVEVAREPETPETTASRRAFPANVEPAAKAGASRSGTALTLGAVALASIAAVLSRRTGKTPK